MRSSRGPRLALTLAILWTASPAPAQEPESPSAVIRLTNQTAWTTPKKPWLRIGLTITNDGGSTIGRPAVGWTLGTKVRSRDQYETALDEGPALSAAAETVPLDEDLAPGASTEVKISIDTSETGAIEESDSGVYPLQLVLRSEDQPIAAVTTAAIHVVRTPLQRVLFSWWTEVATPVAFGPDGTLIDPGFEATLQSRGGVVAQVEAITRLLAGPSGGGVDVIVSPAALDQLRQAADGYERSDGTSVPENAPAPLIAADTLDRLREIAADPDARLHAMPFAAPRLPALLSSGLRTQLGAQWQIGDETFEQILGERPDPTVARPPGLAFDQASVDLLSSRGVTTILGAADSVDRPAQINNYAPLPAATLSTRSGEVVNLLLPDPGAQALLEDPGLQEDPIRAAQVVLGELATIWREQPVPGEDKERGLALDLPYDLPAALWGPAILRLSRAPFLKPVHAEDLPDELLPPPRPAALETSSVEGFTPGYASDIADAVGRVAAFRAILEEPRTEADRLRRAILYAEASQYIGNEGSGRRVWIDAVNDVIDRTFSRLAPDTSRVLTFTSRSGTIPLRMGDPGDRIVNVTVELASGRVEFPDAVRTVRLDEPNQVVTFRAEVKAAGRSRITVFVTSPNGVVLTRSVLVVSSTAVNPIALIITVGAGLVLVGLWSRRLFRRRNP